jgi:hypothetical protein
MYSPHALDLQVLEAKKAISGRIYPGFKLLESQKSLLFTLDLRIIPLLNCLTGV